MGRFGWFEFSFIYVIFLIYIILMTSAMKV